MNPLDNSEFPYKDIIAAVCQHRRWLEPAAAETLNDLGMAKLVAARSELTVFHLISKGYLPHARPSPMLVIWTRIRNDGSTCRMVIDRGSGWPRPVYPLDAVP